MSRGPVVRAEACAGDFYAALDKAIDKLDSRLRRAADRRRVHRGRHAPISVAAATAALADDGFTPPTGLVSGGRATGGRDSPTPRSPTSAVQVDDQPWHIARTKEHTAEPMTVDDALFQMELVGHDFYLFLDKDSGRPSVVYRRRKGYDYGVHQPGRPPDASLDPPATRTGARAGSSRGGRYSGGSRAQWMSSMRVPSGPGRRARWYPSWTNPARSSTRCEARLSGAVPGDHPDDADLFEAPGGHQPDRPGGEAAAPELRQSGCSRSSPAGSRAPSSRGRSRRRTGRRWRRGS